MKPLLQMMLTAFGVENDPAWQAAAQASEFYIVAEKAMSGQYCMGSTEFEVDGVKYLAPCVKPTLEEAQAELAEEQQEHMERLIASNQEQLDEWLAEGNDEADFEPDEDECQIDIYKMRWDGGDLVAIESVCGQFVEDDQNTWQFHTGV